MKIKDVATTWLSIPLNPPLSDSTHVLDKIEWILVDVITDQGLIGHAHMLTFDYAPELLKGVVDKELKKLVIGMDALFIAKVREACWERVEYIGQQGVAAWGMAAIDIALWDILGKYLGCPVYKLLGAYRDKVPIYASGGWLSYSTDQLLGEMECYVRQGFKGVKMKVGSPDPRRDFERVKAVRQALGGDILLMIDANQAWRVHEALEFSRKIRDYNIFWLEEPLSKDDLGGYARLGASIDIPIACGEREYSIGAFRELLKRSAISVVQPDVLRIGGITQFVKLAHLAESFNVRVASHFYKEIDIHLLASMPNGLFLEYFPWLDSFLVKPLQIENGMAKVPNEPGLSIEFRPEAIRESKVG
jgi:L-alanine-DL-glutamate epimerase-like enolase superfamily enzyme